MTVTVHKRTEKAFPIQGWLRVAILGGLGAYFVYNIVSGNLANYINARFVWLNYIAAGLLLMLAVFGAFQLLTADADADKNQDSDVDYDRVLGRNQHQRITWAVLATAALPLLFGVMVPSQPLGAEAINGSIRTSNVQGASSSGFSIAPEQRNVLDWLREFNTSQDYNSINGQPADVIGFVYTEPDYPAGHFMVARFTVSCCVADASAIAMPVEYNDIAALEQGAWVRVTGEVEAREFHGDIAPVIYNATVEVVDTPAHPYLYP